MRQLPMNQTARIISIYAADTSGVCSALFEFGGMTVIHDASGCNSTYTTHDEPRWYDMDSMMYISGLTESDAVMGNDEKFIDDLSTAAQELRPEYIAICASPMPAMIGIDMDAIAYEVENRTGIPAFDVKTNGMQSYITGAGNAFRTLSERFTGTSGKMTSSVGSTADVPKSDTAEIAGKRVNILGMTPLDFPLGTDKELRRWLEKNGFTVNACIGMGTSLDEVRRLDRADVSLVVSSAGRPLAESLQQRYGIPFIVGVPYGKCFAAFLAEELRRAADKKHKLSENSVDEEAASADVGSNVAEKYRSFDSRIAVVGESVLATSLAAAISICTGHGTRVLETVGDGDMSQLSDKDISCDDEERLEEELKASEIVIADPLFRPICRSQRFIRLPHDAFSGRCFKSEEINMIDTDIPFFNTLKEFR